MISVRLDILMFEYMFHHYTIQSIFNIGVQVQRQRHSFSDSETEELESRQKFWSTKLAWSNKSFVILCNCYFARIIYQDKRDYVIHFEFIWNWPSYIYTATKRRLGQFGTMEVSQSLQVGFEILHQISVDWELAWLTVSKLSSLVALLGREVSQARRLSKALQKPYFPNILELVVHI